MRLSRYLADDNWVFSRMQPALALTLDVIFMQCIKKHQFRMCDNISKHEMWTDINNSFTLCILRWTIDLTVQNDGIKYATLPQICCHTTMWNLNIQLYNLLFILASDYFFKLFYRFTLFSNFLSATDNIIFDISVIFCDCLLNIWQGLDNFIVSIDQCCARVEACILPENEHFEHML